MTFESLSACQSESAHTLRLVRVSLQITHDHSNSKRRCGLIHSSALVRFSLLMSLKITAKARIPFGLLKRKEMIAVTRPPPRASQVRSCERHGGEDV